MPRQPKLSTSRNGPYEYWETQHNGKRKRFGRVGVVSEEDARRAFHAFMLGQSEPVETVSVVGTVADLCAAHIVWHKSHNKENTAANRASFLDRFCSHQYRGRDVGVIQAEQITRDVLAAFMSQFSDGWTAWNYCVAVKAAWNWAHREGLISSNPLRGYPNPPQPKADVSESTLITAGEVKWFFEKSVPYGCRPILEVLHATGARPGEMCSATVGDFIKASSQLRLLNWKNGKKTNTARIIPLPADPAKLVAGLCKGKQPTEPIFTGPNNSAWTPNRLQKIWRKIRDGEWRAKKGKKFEQLTEKEAEKRKEKTKQREFLTLYDLRHLWISDALSQQVPVAQIAKLAGTSIKMIERTYGHFRTDDLNTIANQIAERRKK